MDLNCVLVILTIVLIILNLVLVFLTIVYLRHTKRMTNIMVQEFELRIAPILVADPPSSKRGKDDRSYQPIISNKGSLPVKVKAVVIEWWQKESSHKTYEKNKIINRILGVGESTRYGECEITIKKLDMMKDDFEKQKDWDLNQLLSLYQGRLYCTYIDVNGKEQKTRDLRFWETM
jgi:hypothetical protein